MPSNSITLRAAAALLGLALAGCSSADYLNHRDRVTLAGGDAVRANLERETANPFRASRYRIDGLGADGGVIPAEAAPPTTVTNISLTES